MLCLQYYQGWFMSNPYGYVAKTVKGVCVIQSDCRNSEAQESTKYPAIILRALASAKARNSFAPFKPDVLKALLTEYVKGPFAWASVCNAFKAVNRDVALNDLDRAMRTMVPTDAGEDSMSNYSVIIGKALVAAKKDAQAPFEREVLTALAEFLVRDTQCYSRVLQCFNMANREISLDCLDYAIKNKAVKRLFICHPDEYDQIPNYPWDRPCIDFAERLEYWYPVKNRGTLH